MSSKSTTKENGENVAASENSIKQIGEAASKISVNDELLPQDEASENGTQAIIESGNVLEDYESKTKKKVATAGKSKPKKVKAEVAKSQPKKKEAAANSKLKKTEGSAAKSKTQKVEAAAKSKPEKTVQKKAVSIGKVVAANGKKIKLASSTYHYYRNWLAEFMRSHGVPSAKFQKSPESYNGHITVLEADKAKGLKALEQWSKQNPDTKELFWDIKK